MALKPICSIPDCDKPSRTACLCQGHYLRKLRYGDPMGGKHYVKPTADGLCSIEGCEKKSHDKGMCSMHAARVRIHGDANKGAKKPRGVCSVEGCDSAHYGGGYCLPHWRRNKKYGSPTAGGPFRGEVRAFMDSVIVSNTDSCIPYPYCRTKDGYGRFNPDKTTVGAHCYVAEQVYGPKPSPEHECCHSCGNGHLGCVNPRHLYWGTRADNVRDAINHGTAKFFGRVRISLG